MELSFPDKLATWNLMLFCWPPISWKEDKIFTQKTQFTNLVREEFEKCQLLQHKFAPKFGWAPDLKCGVAAPLPGPVVGGHVPPDGVEFIDVQQLMGEEVGHHQQRLPHQEHVVAAAHRTADAKLKNQQ